jgi:hypothetical protein
VREAEEWEGTWERPPDPACSQRPNNRGKAYRSRGSCPRGGRREGSSRILREKLNELIIPGGH